jgi:hypothetical protein
LQIATTLDFSGDVLGNIFRPPLSWIEGDNPDRLAIFSGKQILDNDFYRPLQVCFAPGAAIAAEVVWDEIDSFVAVRGNRQEPSELTHKQLTQRNRDSI